MDFGFEAHYMGVRYPAAVGPESGDVTLFTSKTPELHLGFEACQGYWRKHLKRTEIQGLTLIRTFGAFRGERCFVLERSGDQMHIAYAGHDAYHAEHLGYWMVDRGVYEAVVPASEVPETWVERIDLPAGPAAALAPAAPAALGEPAAPEPAAPAPEPALPQATATPAPHPPSLPFAPAAPVPASPTEPVPASSVPEPRPAESPQSVPATGSPARTDEPAPGRPRTMTLISGTLIDRFGPEKGRLVFDQGTPFEHRSLPVAHREYNRHVYRVSSPMGLAVLGGPVAPWFGQPGGGVMYELPRTVEELVDLSALERVEDAS